MDKFRDAYQEACKELPAPSMDLEKVRDEARHQRMLRNRRRYMITKGCTAAAVFVLCGAGTVAAKNYRDSVIEVREKGFTITSSRDMPAETRNQKSQEYEPDVASFLKMGGVFSIEEGIPEGEELTGQGDGKDVGGAYIVESMIEYDIREYDSIESFWETETVTAVIPEKTLFEEEFTRESVQVLDEGRRVMASMSNDDVYFFMTQSDNRDCESYSSSTTYDGQCANKRNFTNNQGMSFVMFDSVDEEGNVISIHAVISANGWDLSMTFEGFGEDVVEKVLKTIDLSAYFL